LALGDSITYGWESTDGNGYRYDLQQLSKSDGNTITYIGSIQAGTMADNWNDGYIGCVIDQIASQSTPALAMKPQVVLLMAGTNDINYQEDLANAPSRLSTLITEILTYSPSAVILVAAIPLIEDSTLEPLAETYNSGVQSMLNTRIASGNKLVWVPRPSGWTTSDMADELHPNDTGYSLLATAWHTGIVSAQSKGWI
ncbi:SGNH hydrolase, partial [Clavulina sp. PMI_390]